MTQHPFPQETVNLIYASADKAGRDFTKPTIHALGLMKSFSDSYYSFRDAMCSGKYAEYLHERLDSSNNGYNCTTIIPELYLYCERLGLKPEIVQFVGMREVKSKTEVNDTGESTVHFAVTVDLGKKQRYLMDPFWNRFGPIKKQDGQAMVIGSFREYRKARREFKAARTVDVQEFAEMMGRLHDPAGSLEMLVSGQKIYKNKPIAKTDCQLMVYFDQDNDVVSTRLAVPQTGISNKAIYCQMEMTANGYVRKTSLDLFLAKEFQWIGLKEGKLVAHSTFVEMSELRRELRAIPGYLKAGRIGPALEEKIPSSLEIVADRLLSGIAGGVDVIQRQIYARALYELEQPGQEYVFSVEERERRIMELRKEYFDFQEKIKPLREQLWYVDWKLQSISPKERRRLKRDKNRITKKINSIIEEIDGLNNLRYFNKKTFHRRMDQILFAKRVEGASADDFKDMVQRAGIDPRIGYLALVADFLPFVVQGRKYLTLRHLTLRESMDHLQTKIAVKHGKIHLIDGGVIADIPEMIVKNVPPGLNSV